MITPFFSDNDNSVLYNGDTTTMLSEIKDKVDVIFADPPYFFQAKNKLHKMVKKVCDKGEWDRVTTLGKINDFNRTWLSKYRDILKDNGTIWVCGTYHNIYSVELY